MKSDTKPVDIKDDNHKEESSPTIVKPKLLKQSMVEKTTYPLKSLAGATNSFFGAIWEDIPDMTESEKQDASELFNMLLGNTLNRSENAQKIVGGVGLIGLYSARIKKARKIKKQRESPKQDKDDNIPDSQNTSNIKYNYTESKPNQEDMIVTDT